MSKAEIFNKSEWSIKEMKEQILRDREAYRERHWIKGLEEKIDGLEFKKGDLIYIQFNPAIRSIFDYGAVFGKIISVGEDLEYISDSLYGEKSRKRAEENFRETEKFNRQSEESNGESKVIFVNSYYDPERSDFNFRDPEIGRAVMALYDSSFASAWGIHYSSENGKRILINGFPLKKIYTGLEIVGGTDSFTKLYHSNLDNQLLVNTEFLKEVNADVFLGGDIEEGVKNYQRETYLPVIDKIIERRMLEAEQD